jgi:short-subunit dehydrogenase
MTASITSNPQLGFDTTAEEVASSLASQIAGKVILVTGVTPGGLGAHFVEVTAAHKPKLLILAGRSSEKLAEVAKEVESAHQDVATRTLVLDLSSQAKVRKAGRGG